MDQSDGYFLHHCLYLCKTRPHVGPVCSLKESSTMVIDNCLPNLFFIAMTSFVYPVLSEFSPMYLT